jgi:RNA polymerase sigma factor (sigma-70 family)
MARGSTKSALRQIRTLFELGTLGGLTDAQLLELFLTRSGDDAEDAFAALVHRHGPMVLAVCRRMLPNSHDAEDAFQATFLILARRAGAIGQRERLANWLYGVAVRTAKEARRRAARREARERRAMERTKVESEPAGDGDDLIPILDEELSRLPDRYRAALVACELEGKSRQDAAQQLGLPEGTLSTHLARGRKLLRERLVQRGVSLGVGAWAGLPRGAVEAAVPDRLLSSTVQAALGPAAGGVASGTVSATVTALAEGVLKMMVLTRLTLIVAAVMGVGVASLGAYAAWPAVPAERVEPPKAPVVAKVDDPAPGDQAVTGVDARRARVHGVVVDEAGKPVPGIDVRDFNDPPARGITDELGRFDFRVPSPLLSGTSLLARTADHSRQGIHRYDFELLETETKQPIRIILKPSREVVVRVTDKAGVPVPGAAVETLPSYAIVMADNKGTAVLRIPADAAVSRIIGLKSGRGFDDYQHGEPGRGDPAMELPGSVHLVLNGARTVQIRAIDSAGKPLAGISFSPSVVRKVGKKDGNVFTFQSEIAQATTDERGVATFNWIPPTTAPLFFETRSAGYHTAALRNLQEDETGKMLTAQLVRDGTIRGHVVRPDGKPAAGILMMTEEGRGRGYTRRLLDRTAADGSYELTVPSNESYFVAVADDEWATRGVEVTVPEGRPVEGLDFRLARGTLVHGMLTIGPDRQPGEGRNVLLSTQAQIERSVATDAKGHYQIRVGPGTYALGIPNEHLSGDQVKDVYEGRENNPASKSHHLEIVMETITVKDEEELIRNLWIPKPETGPISGRVVLAGEPARGVAGAKVQGLALPPSWAPTVADAEGRFHAQRRLQKTVVHARSPDGSLGGLIEIRGDDREIVIPVSPTATMTGIILDERGHPMANVEVTSERYVREDDGRGRFREGFTPTVLTDDRGRFALPELLVGQEYDISVPSGNKSWYIVTWVKPQEGGPLELGTLTVKVGMAVAMSFRAGKPAAGDPAPRFEAKTLDGRSIKLEDIRGKYVLLDFWATSCEPCMSEIPSLQAIHGAFSRDERLVILSLSIDETIEIPRQFQEKWKRPWMQGFLGKGIDGAVPARYGVRAIPAFVLIGPDGKIVAKGMRGEEIQKAVSRALAGP